MVDEKNSNYAYYCKKDCAPKKLKTLNALSDSDNNSDSDNEFELGPQNLDDSETNFKFRNEKQKKINIIS